MIRKLLTAASLATLAMTSIFTQPASAAAPASAYPPLPPATGTVSGHVYYDSNGNGTQDLGEPDLPNVQVVVTDSSGTPQTVLTDSNGNWSATVAPGPGSADVVDSTVVTSAIAVGVIQSGPVKQTEGTDPTPFTGVTGTNVDGGIDGYSKTDVASQSPNLPGTVHGHVYYDTNRNGTQDSNEPNLANVRVVITDSTGKKQTVVTDANGDWRASVPAGPVTADVDETSLPAGVTQTEGTDPTTVTAVAGKNVHGGIDGYGPAQVASKGPVPKTKSLARTGVESGTLARGAAGAALLGAALVLVSRRRRTSNAD